MSGPPKANPLLPENSSWLTLPISGQIWLCELVDGDLTPRLPVVPAAGSEDERLAMRKDPSLHDSLASPDGKYVAIRSHGGKTLFVFENTSETEAKMLNLELPDDMAKVHCVAFHGDRLYVGGEARTNPGSRLGVFDLSLNKPRMSGLDLPKSHARKGPAVVGLKVDGDRLIAIDAASTPKQVLAFDIDIDPLDPEPMWETRIPSGIDDIVLDLAIGRSYAALLSESHSESGRAWKIGVYDRENFDEVSTFFHRTPWKESHNVPSQVEFIDDVLVIAHGIRGMGHVRLQDDKPSRFEGLRPIPPWLHPFIPLHRIQYLEPLGPGRVVAIEVVEEPGTIFAVAKSGKSTWWEQFQL